MLSRCGMLLRTRAYTSSIKSLQVEVITASAGTGSSPASHNSQRSYHIASPGSTFRSSTASRNATSLFSVRHQSQTSAAAATSIAVAPPAVSPLANATSPLEFIPIPDAPLAPVAELAAALAPGAEPAFATLGLGGWTPVGIVQNCMEFLHINLEIPWWGAIMIGTICVRTIILPLVIMAQRNAAKMGNNMPQMQTLQLKMTEARQAGNSVDSARYAQEMMTFMKSKNLNPLKNMIVPLAQAPVFVSFFIGLRQMANAPVESLREGGLFWFTDLTMPDQYFLLPVLTSATLYLTIELGTDGAKLAAQNMQTMRYVLRAMPLIIFPFTMSFPGIILSYWACSNFISLCQVGILKIPAVRDLCKIERSIDHPVESLPIKKKGFVEGFQDSWTNMKITRELAERERIDEIQFQRAGQGPLVKTYKYDPTKVPVPTVRSSVTVESKKL